MPRLQVLHLSDFHLVWNYRISRQTVGLPVYNRDVLRAIAEIVYKWRNQIDAIVISGDIADLGNDRDIKSALDFLIQPPDSLSKEPWLNSKRKPTIQPFGKHIVLMPGNHDRFRNFAGIPGARFFDNFFSSYWNVGVGGIQSYFIPNQEEPTLAIICGDFTLADITDAEGVFGHFGQGKIYRDRLNNLVSRTNSITKSYPTCGIIWMLHFAPKFEEYFDLINQMRLINSDHLIEEAEKAGVRHIFCGHTHRNETYLTGNHDKVWIHCAGTSSCLNSKDDTTIHLRQIEIESGRIVEIKSIDLKWDSGQETFL